MSISKNVDLKCSETLRDSPPPPPPPPQLQLPHPLGSTSVFASTIVAPSPNPPSHHSIPPLVTTGSAFGHLPSQQQTPTVSLLVRKFESQRGSSPVGRIPNSESAGAREKLGSNNASTASSLSFGIANVVSAPRPSLSSHYSTQVQQTSAAFSSPQQASHVFSGLPLPGGATSSVWPFVQQHAVLPSQLSTSPSKQAIFAPLASVQSSPTKGHGAAAATLPLSLSPSKASGGSITQGRPVTLHVSTSRGQAVLQLQQSATTSSAASSTPGKQSVKLLPASTAGGRSVIVSMAGSHLLSSPGSHATVESGGFSSASATAPSVKSSAPLTPSSASAPINPSPTRPSILRKRMTDLSNGSNSGSPTAKRLAYESVTLARRANEKGALTPDSDSRPGTSLASAISSSTVENPEAGNSNQSSSASTISAGSTVDNGNGNGHSANSSQATITGSPSPRKRPRKQQLSELTSSRGYGSDEDTSTPVMSFHCEAVEEETVMGPTGVGGAGGRYLPSSVSPQRSQHSIGQGSIFMAGDLYEQYQSPSKRQTIKSEFSGSSPGGFSGSQRQSHSFFERPSTSFDQLQQQIEQQRKHVPEYRPRPSLLAQYELPYDSKRYHFAVEEDVRPKDEKRPTMVEMSNQKQISQRIAGWKAHLMAVQFDNVDRDEKTNYEDLNEVFGLLNSWASLEAEDRVGQMDFPDAEERTEIETLKEMALTNMQRVRVIREQLEDGKKQLLSLLKHKGNVERLIHRYTSKRPIRKKDRGKNGTIVD